MNSKARVMTAINHRIPDRVPSSMNASPWVLQRLKEKLDVSGDRELMGELGIDIFDMRGLDIGGRVAPRYVGEPCHRASPNTWTGNPLPLWGIDQEVVETQHGRMYQSQKPNLSGAESIEALKDYGWPDPDLFEYDNIPIELEKWSEFAVLCSGASVFQHPCFVRGMDKLLMDLTRNPDMANFLLDRFADFYCEYYSRIFEAAGDMIDLFWIADDFGMQDKLMMSPSHFEQYFVPRLKKLIDMAKSHGAKVLLHSDGNVREIIPRLIEIGVDILDPIQPEAEGMEPGEIKKEFGDQLCLRGGVSAQDVLSTGSPENVREEVKRRIDQLGPGGGYILSPGHPVLQVDIPTENIITMYRTAREYGKYG